MRLAPLLLGLALVAASGCLSGEAHSATQGPPPRDVGPHVTMMPSWGTQFRWLVLLHDNLTTPFPNASVTFEVEKRGGIPDGGPQTRQTTIEAGRDANVQFATPALGYGDYFYSVKVVDESGTAIGSLSGMYETCAC